MTFDWTPYEARIKRLWETEPSVPAMHQRLKQEWPDFKPSLRALYDQLKRMKLSTAPTRKKEQKQTSKSNQALQEQVRLNLAAPPPVKAVSATSTGCDHEPTSKAMRPSFKRSAMPGNWPQQASMGTPQPAASMTSPTTTGHSRPFEPLEPSPGGSATSIDTTGRPSFQLPHLPHPTDLIASRESPSDLTLPMQRTPVSPSFGQTFAEIEPELEHMMMTDSRGSLLHLPTQAITLDTTQNSPADGPLSMFTFFDSDSSGKTSSQVPSTQRLRTSDKRTQFAPNRSVLQLRTENSRPAVNRNSTATDDSGYASGRGSPFGSVNEALHFDPRSTLEFGGLHRVPCHCLHEPEAPHQQIDQPQAHYIYRDLQQTCHVCHYSGIHNLSWSARYLKFEVFEAELKLTLNPLYDHQAIDMAGNSGLHFAAAAGAGPRCLNALIEAGLDRYQLNTAGQLFLHCWRLGGQDNEGKPSPNLDKLLFESELVNLLNKLHYRGTAAVNWRDNEGFTPFDIRKPITQDPELDARIRWVVGNAGYSSAVPELVGNHSTTPVSDLASPSPLNRTRPSPLTGKLLASPMTRNSSGNGWESEQARQNKAFEILGRAKTKPLWVDPETGENPLHALARVKLASAAEMLRSIRKHIDKGVDLNLQNNEHCSPLSAFVRDRPWPGVDYDDETGAIRARYLDALLWKDTHHYVPNIINVDLRDESGATTLYHAAILGRPDSVRSLIAAGANVNATKDTEGIRISILQATLNAKSEAICSNDIIKIHLLHNVISYLELEGAVLDPIMGEERRVYPLRLARLPL